jgi:hypothetical protein
MLFLLLRPDCRKPHLTLERLTPTTSRSNRLPPHAFGVDETLHTLW